MVEMHAIQKRISFQERLFFRTMFNRKHPNLTVHICFSWESERSIPCVLNSSSKFPYNSISEVPDNSLIN